MPLNYPKRGTGTDDIFDQKKNLREAGQINKQFELNQQEQKRRQIETQISNKQRELNHWVAELSNLKRQLEIKKGEKTNKTFLLQELERKIRQNQTGLLYLQKSTSNRRRISGNGAILNKASNKITEIAGQINTIQEKIRAQKELQQSLENRRKNLETDLIKVKEEIIQAKHRALDLD